MGENVAVVGGTGFLGANVVAAVAEAGYTPIVVARFPEKAKRPLPDLDVEVRYGDITKLDSLRTALQGCTYVHTVAAIVGEIFTDPNPDHREAALRVNVDGTVNVLRAAHENGAKRVVVTSSCSTRYQPGGALANEDSPAIGDTVVPDPYVTSKVGLERAIADFSRQTGLEVVAILAGGFVGPRDAYPKLMGKNVLDRLNGESSAGIGLEGVIPFVDVRDVARAHVRAMEIENPRQAYLVVADPVSMADWSKVFDRVTGLTTKARIIPTKLAMPMALVFEVVAWLRREPAMMNRNAIRHSIQCQQYDTSRAREDLGITYTRPETTIRDTARWFVDNGYVTNEENLAILKESLAAVDAAVA